MGITKYFCLRHKRSGLYIYPPNGIPRNGEHVVFLAAPKDFQHESYGAYYTSSMLFEWDNNYLKHVHSKMYIIPEDINENHGNYNDIALLYVEKSESRCSNQSVCTTTSTNPTTTSSSSNVAELYRHCLNDFQFEDFNTGSTQVAKFQLTWENNCLKDVISGRFIHPWKGTARNNILLVLHTHGARPELEMEEIPVPQVDTGSSSFEVKQSSTVEHVSSMIISANNTNSNNNNILFPPEMFCPVDGVKLRQNANYCPKCGRKRRIENLNIHTVGQHLEDGHQF